MILAIYYYMRLNQTNQNPEGVKEFVSFYPERTQIQYISAIKYYLIQFHPQLTEYKRGQKEAMLAELDPLSIQYLEEIIAGKDFKQDLMEYKKSLAGYAPKTRILRYYSLAKNGTACVYPCRTNGIRENNFHQSSLGDTRWK